jgi:5-methylcytosine-specific restriction endonuclease McrA
MTDEQKKKLSLAKKGVKRSQQITEKLKGIMPKGEKHWNWKGGKSYEPYIDRWNEIRKEIYKRDNWTCQECHNKCSGIKSKTYKRIQCHHIDQDKKNCNPNNLITLCSSCHIRIHIKDNKRKETHG